MLVFVSNGHGQESQLTINAHLPIDLHLTPINSADSDGIIGHFLERVNVIVSDQQYIVILPHFVEMSHNKQNEVVRHTRKGLI